MFLSRLNRRILRLLQMIGRASCTEEIEHALGSVDREDLVGLEGLGFVKMTIPPGSRREFWELTQEGHHEIASSHHQ